MNSDLQEAETRHDDGFTLVELLVATALVAILAVYCISAVQRLQDIRRVEALVQLNEERDAGRSFLTRAISGARVSFGGSTTPQQPISFKGNEMSLITTNTLDDRLVRGGLYQLTFQFDDTSGVLGFTRMLARQNAQAPANERQIILRDLSSVKFQYYGLTADGSQKNWQQEWNKNFLPNAVRIDLQFKSDASGRSEPLLVPIMTAN
jgi:prepilin-type N-terminal cleavage/methylation domain-containing protein